MFKNVHPSYIIVPIALIAGYAIFYPDISEWGRTFTAGMIGFISLICISLIIWPKG